MKELSIREKAAIALLISEPKTSPSQIYRAAHSGSLDHVEGLADLPATASRWLHSKRIQDYLRSQEREQNERETKLKDAVIAETLARVRKSDPGASLEQNIDYGKPQNRLRLYNAIIAKSGDDPKTQLDAAKMFEQVQRDDREAAKVQKQTRVYLPLRCEACPLYIEAKEKLKLKKL